MDTDSALRLLTTMNRFRNALHPSRITSIARNALLLILLSAFATSAASGALTAEMSIPPSIDNCNDHGPGNDGTIALIITNAADSGADATDITAQLTLPAAFEYEHGTGRITMIPHSGDKTTPAAVEPTVATDSNGWQVLTWNGLSLAPQDKVMVSFKMIPSCSVNALDHHVTYQIDYKLAGADQAPVTGTTPCAITVNKVNIQVTNTFSNGQAMITGSIGQEVTMTVTISNIGTGPAYHISAWDVVGYGLQVTGVNGDVGSKGVTEGLHSKDGIPFGWEYDTIASGSSKVVTVTARIIDCKNLNSDAFANSECTLGNPCQLDAHAYASVEFVPRYPAFSYTMPESDLAVPYCRGAQASIDYSNSGTGPANNVHIILKDMPTDYEVDPGSVTGAIYTYDPGNKIGTFTISNPGGDGNVLPGGSGTIGFQIKARNGACSPPEGAITLVPDYQDEIGSKWSTPISILTCSPKASSKPDLAASETGPDGLKIGEAGTYHLSITYSRNDCSQTAVTASIVDTYPTDFEVVDAAGGSVDSGAHTITWASQTLNSGAAWTKDIQLRPASSFVCNMVTNMVAVNAVSDCCSCPLSGTSSKDTVVSSDNPGSFTSTKTATPGTQENGRDIAYKTTYTFPDATRFAQGWADIFFRDQGNNEQTLVAGTSKFKVTGGSNPSYSHEVTNHPVTPGSKIQLDFLNTECKPLESGMVLEVSYTFHQIKAGSFVDWSDLMAYGQNFHEGVPVKVGRSDFSIDMTYPDKMDPCGEYDLSINLHQEGPYDGHQMSVTYDDTNFEYVGSATYHPAVISGINGNCAAIASFEPTRGNGDDIHKLTWTLGDNINCGTPPQTGTITIRVKKTCQQDRYISCALDYRDRCNNPLQDTFTKEPQIIDSADLRLTMTPEVACAVQKRVYWKIYLANMGRGTSHDTALVDTLGTGLTYATGTVKLDGHDPDSGTLSVNGQEIDLNVPDMMPGTVHVIEIGGDVTGCSFLPLENDAVVHWCCGCAWPECVDTVASSKVDLAQTDLQIVNHIAPQIDPCGGDSSDFVIGMKNSGEAFAYQVSINELLPAGMEIVPDSSTYTYANYKGQVTPPGPGNSLTWTFADPWAPGADITIRFKAKVTYADAFKAEVCPTAVTQATFQLPCGSSRQSAQSSVSIPKFYPYLSISMNPSTSVISDDNSLRWMIKVRNSGDYDAKNIVIKDVLPQNVATAYDASNQPAVTLNGNRIYPKFTKSGQNLEWDLKDQKTDKPITIPSLGDLEITIDAQATGCSEDTTNRATVEWGCNDPKDSATATSSIVTTPKIDISLARPENQKLDQKQSSLPMTTCGGTRYITITNSGATAFAPCNNGPELVYAIPDGFTYAPGSATIATKYTHTTELSPEPTVGGGKLTWTGSNIDKINPGEIIFVTLALVSDAAACGTKPESPVESATWSYYTSCDIQSCPSANLKSASTGDSPIAIVKPSLKAGIILVNKAQSPGETANWEVSVTNTGDGPADNLRIDDVFGLGFANIKAYSDKGLKYVDKEAAMSGQTLTWSKQSIASDPGKNVWRRWITADIQSTGKLTNQLTATGTCADTGCRYSQATTTSTIDRPASAELTLTRDSSTPKTIGDAEDFTIRISFGGSASYYNAMIADSLPDGLRFNSFDCISGPCGTFTQKGQALSWALSDSTPFEGPRDVEIKVHTTVTDVSSNKAETTLQNTASVYCEDSQGTPVSQKDSTYVPIVEPSLAISRSAGGLTPGSTVPYTLTILAASSAYSSDAHDLVVADHLPDHMTYIDSDPEGSYDSAARTITWRIDHLEANRSLTLQYDARADSDIPSGQMLTSDATLTWTSISGPSDDERTYTAESILSLDAQSRIEKIFSGPATRTIGDAVDYTVQTTLPKSTARSVTIEDELPKGLIYSSCTVTPAKPGSIDVQDPAQVSNADGTTTLTWSFGDVDNSNNDENIRIDVSIIVSSDPSSTSYVNSAGTLIDANQATLAWTDASDKKHTTNAFSKPISVAEPSLTFTKKIGSIALPMGGCKDCLPQVNFALVIAAASGRGCSDAYDLVVKDVVPEHMNYVANPNPTDPNSAGSYDLDSRTITWSIDHLAAGQYTIVRYTAEMDTASDPDKMLENNAKLSWTSLAGPDKNERSYDDQSSLSINPRVLNGISLEVHASDSLSSQTGPAGLISGGAVTRTIGDTVLYTISASLPASATVKSVSIVDKLPRGLTFSSYTLSPDQPGSIKVQPPRVDLGADGWTTLMWDFGDVDNSDSYYPLNIDINVYAKISNDPGHNPYTNNAGMTIDAGEALLNWFDSDGIEHTPSAHSYPFLITEPSLTIADSANPTGPLYPETTVPYTVTVQAAKGTGWSDAYDLVVTDHLPEHMTYIDSDPVGSYDPSTRTITWSIDHLNAGASSTLKFNARIDNGVAAGLRLTNNAALSWTSEAGANPDERSYAGACSSHIALDTGGSGDGGSHDGGSGDGGSDTPGISNVINGLTSRTIGESFRYTLYASLPRTVVPSVQITDTLPKGLILDASTVAITGAGTLMSQSVQANADGTTTVRWNFLNVDNSQGQNIKIEFNAIVADIQENQDPGTIPPNTAGLSWTDANGASHQTQDAPSSPVTIIEPDLSISAAADKVSSLSAGDDVLCSLNIHHTAQSHSDAYDLVITDTLPAGMTYVAGSESAPSGISFAPSQDSQTKIWTLTWTCSCLPRAMPPESNAQVLSYRATVNSGLATRQNLDGAARLTWTSTPGINPNDRTGEGGMNDYCRMAIITISTGNATSHPAVNVTTTARPISASPGAQIDFAIDVANTGDVPLKDLVMTDQLPQGLSYISDDKKGSASSGIITWRFDMLNVEQSISIHLLARIDKDISGKLVNGVKVNASDCMTGQMINRSNFTTVTSKVPKIKVAQTVGLPEPDQYGQFCDSRTASGNGRIESTMSVKDKGLALDYSAAMDGQGDIDLSSVQAMSEKANHLQRDISAIGQANKSSLNFYDDSKISFAGNTPLTGSKSLRSSSFYGGMGASLDESFQADQMDNEETAYFGSTANATQPQVAGMDTRSSFNGTMYAAENVHKIFENKINSHSTFTGKFEMDKSVKINQEACGDPGLGGASTPCEGIDC